MWHVKVRIDGKWTETYASPDILDTLDVYNESDVPRMLLGPGGIRHKQYSDNGFQYRPDWAKTDK